MTHDYVISLLEISPEEEISSSGGHPFIFIIFLVTFPQPVYVVQFPIVGTEMWFQGQLDKPLPM